MAPMTRSRSGDRGVFVGRCYALIDEVGVERSRYVRLKMVHGVYRYILGHSHWLWTMKPLVKTMYEKLDEFESDGMSCREADRYRRALVLYF